MKIFHCIIFLMTGLLMNCQSANKQGEPIPEKGIAVYLITSSVDLQTNPTALDKGSVSLAKDPLISYEQIESYSPNSYSLRVKSEVVERLREVSNDLPSEGKPFALVMDGTVVYYGLFWNPISSFGSGYPYIVLFKDSLSQASTAIDLNVAFRTPFPGSPPRPDLRNDSRLLDRLKQDNKLK